MSGATNKTLLIGPYDPEGGEYTFLSPPLGVWRLSGVLASAGWPASVFDPNCCQDTPEAALTELVSGSRWPVIGFSLTGMTLRFDLALAHLVRRLCPEAVLVAGGMEATFAPEQVLRLGPFDLAVLGEGERPLLEILRRSARGEPLSGIAGTARRKPDGRIERLPQVALGREELRDAIFATPYQRMPYRDYWKKLEEAYRVDGLPTKAEREARLSEIRSVRLITLNYCPMGCTFCSSTNFLNDAQGGTARIGRLDAAECLQMIERIVGSYPDVRTIIFQDDIFVFTSDRRLQPLCEAIVEAKRDGRIPSNLQFISTNRIDAMRDDRLALMKRAGFRVLGFGIESFAPRVLAEFNKAQIVPHVEPMLRAALRLDMTPFLDLILTSPRSTLADLAETVREGYRWTVAGCEAGMYPYVIPFSGAAMSADPTLADHTLYETRRVAGTAISWRQATKILPLDTATRESILRIEESFDASIAMLEREVPHLPSRIRSLLWVACATPILASAGERMPGCDAVVDALVSRLPGLQSLRRNALRGELEGRVADRAV